MALFGQSFDHAFSWYADVRNKKTGKPRTYYMGGRVSREDVAEHIAVHYPHVEVLSIAPCISQPTRVLIPVPPEDYEYGHRVACEKMMAEQQELNDRNLWYATKPLKLKPLSLKPLAVKPISLKPLSMSM